MNAPENKLQDVYRIRVLEHSKDPHHFYRPAKSDREALGFNPLCGDKLTVYLHVNSGQIEDIGFEGVGCAISIASASMMTDAVLGQPVADAEEMIKQVQAMFSEGSILKHECLDELAALESVRAYPSRIKCATLAWSTLDAALNKRVDQVSTE